MDIGTLPGPNGRTAFPFPFSIFHFPFPVSRLTMHRILIVVIALAGWAGSTRADETVDRALRDDVVLRALVDELQRGQDGLKLEDLARPYFIEYAVIDAARVDVGAEWGAITRSAEGRQRRLRAEVRVGSYELDNTNFRGGGGGGGVIPTEDDYAAIRQAVWWATDREYKNVAEVYAQKKAFMESKLIEDKPPDFSHETPTVYIEDRGPVAVEAAPLQQLAVTLSAVFKDYPDLQDSGVSVQGLVGNEYLVNTEGTRLRSAGARYAVSVTATVQADDGMKLSDALAVYGETWADLPPAAELSARCRQLAERLLAVRQAPTLASYTGPVLFDPEPATEVFSQNFGSRFDGGQRPVGSQSDPDDFEKKLNRRILPRFLNVVDDPTLETVAGVKAMGHYRYDAQAVPAQAVSLVENGRLKNLLMARNPSKAFGQSNGHGRGLFRPTAAVGSLLVTATDATAPAGLLDELRDACADEGLEFGLRVAALGSVGGAAAPLVTYKVFPDGREELVRGAQIAEMDLKAFKRILAAGDTPYVLNSASWSGSTTVSVPALLFEELDLAKVDRDFDKPPILPSPLARLRAGAKPAAAPQ
jgi:TldD protein